MLIYNVTIYIMLLYSQWLKGYADKVTLTLLNILRPSIRVGYFPSEIYIFLQL